MTLIELMQVEVIELDEYSWLRCTVPGNCPQFESSARTLAERILRTRCGAATQIHDAWLQSMEGGCALSEGQRAALRAFIRPGFGVPEKPLSADHVQGMTAEYLWYFATTDYAAANEIDIASVQPPGPSPSASGGDGLVLFRDGEQYPFFLWEIKKNTGVAHVSTTVKRAYGQLMANGMEYIARYVAPASLDARGDPAMLQAVSCMVEDWAAASPRAGVGVAVATSFHKCPARCFSTFPVNFPALKPRLRGVVYGIGDFAAFADRVRDSLWTVL